MRAFDNSKHGPGCRVYHALPLGHARRHYRKGHKEFEHRNGMFDVGSRTLGHARRHYRKGHKEFGHRKGMLDAILYASQISEVGLWDMQQGITAKAIKSSNIDMGCLMLFFTPPRSTKWDFRRCKKALTQRP